MVPRRRFLLTLILRSKLEPQRAAKDSPDVREPLSAGGNALGEIAVTRSLKHAAPLGAQQERSIARIRLFEILP